MKKFNVKALPAASFLLCLLALFAVGVRTFAVSVYVGSGYLRGISSSAFKVTETYFNDSLPTKSIFIDINSFVDRITGKRMKNEYVKLNNGKLAYVMDQEDTAPFADAVIALNEYLKSTVKTPLLYVQLPFSIDPDDQQLPPGCEDYSDENADAFLSLIEARGVKTYDFRPLINSKPDYYSQFYRTDHHWKAETAFAAARELITYLAAQDPAYAVDETVTEEKNYQYKSVDNFLGSIGRQFGYGYSGYEPLTTICPSFALDLEVFDEKGKTIQRGDAEKTVLFPEKLSYEDHYLCDMYSYYMDGDHDYRRFVNRTEGLALAQKKLLIIKDSYANALMPYLIYGYREVTVVDLRSLKTPLTEVIEKEKADFVMMAYNPGALTKNNKSMFRFFGESNQTEPEQ